MNFSFNYNKIMIYYLLSCVHQTYYIIDVYHVNIIFCLYPTLYLIISISYHSYQADPKSCLSRQLIISS